jgi:2-oxoglutarate dehydrogenase E2 component (dihydrolipoamide succinyltransferase)
MPVSITIPEMGESVRTGTVARWAVASGASVKRDQLVMELETDKVTAEILAPADGVLKHLAKVGEVVNVGQSVGEVDPAGIASASPAAPASAPAAIAAPVAAAAGNGSAVHHSEVRATPLAEKIAKEQGLDLSKIAPTGPGGRVREADVKAFSAAPAAPAAPAAKPAATAPAPAPIMPKGGVRRERLTPLRARIAERLVQAQHTAAMLTTFNEVDLSAVMALRSKYKEDFEKKHGTGLGFMSFFVKAVCGGLRQFPIVNAYLVQAADGGIEVEHHESMDISIAVSTPKGLTVPVLRGCQHLSFAQVEAGIKDLALKARDGKLTLDQLQGGTFTITNGGIYGSLISTPILNAPQSAILGMHAIKSRPVENPDKPGEIVLRPMMYLALSYDHRLLDGSDAVQFLVAIKNGLERPERLLLEV